MTAVWAKVVAQGGKRWDWKKGPPTNTGYKLLLDGTTTRASEGKTPAKWTILTECREIEVGDLVREKPDPVRPELLQI